MSIDNATLLLILLILLTIDIAFLGNKLSSVARIISVILTTNAVFSTKDSLRDNKFFDLLW